MDRLLLLMENKGNRRLLEELLAKKYDVVPSDAERPLETAFDLCIIDSLSLGRLWEQVQIRRQAELPAFLPVLLLTSRQDIGMDSRLSQLARFFKITPRENAEMHSQQVWQGVDELIVTPIEKAELRARVEILLRARRLSQQNVTLRRQLEAELARAAKVQAALLPDTYPDLPEFEVAARCLPAREVGGDFYDWQETGRGRLRLTLGDVMGKGMPAALLMATTRAALQAVAHQNPPAATVELTQRALAVDFERSGGYVTLFHAELNSATRRLTYVDAGHGHVFLRRSDGHIESLEPRGLPLGLFREERYQDGIADFRAGDALVLYSDGLIDARRDLVLTPTMFADRLGGASSAGEMVDCLVALPELTGPPPDDLTVLVLRCREVGSTAR